MTRQPARIAYFVSSHGFGHAARSAAVMEQTAVRNPSTCFDIYTTTPQWFFEDSLTASFRYHFQQTDVGLAQPTPFYSDIPGTIQQLNDFYPLSEQLLTEVSRELQQNEIAAAICDISPLGIEAARRAGIPSLLIENFTWDWIYQPHEEAYPDISAHIRYLKNLFRKADYHIQTEPIGEKHPSDMSIMPVSRKITVDRDTIRDRLGIHPDEKTVMITTGGIKQELAFLHQLQSGRKIRFIIPGGSLHTEISGNVILLPHRSEFFHPDLVNASDAVIGKAGYSTIAEVYHARVPFGFVARPDFRESEKLVAFIQKEMACLPIPEADFQNGSWLGMVDKLLALPPHPEPAPNGADRIAEFICRLL